MFYSIVRSLIRLMDSDSTATVVAKSKSKRASKTRAAGAEDRALSLRRDVGASGRGPRGDEEGQVLAAAAHRIHVRTSGPPAGRS